MSPPTTSRRCSATTASGAPCRAWAIRDSEPPLCASHAGRARGGAPLHNTNRLRHGAYSSFIPAGMMATLAAATNDPEPRLAGITADLMKQYTRLSSMIDYCLLHLETYSLTDAIALMTLHARTASRLGRLLQLDTPDPSSTLADLESMKDIDLLAAMMDIGSILVQRGLLGKDETIPDE